MVRAYNVIDPDGHILEPPTLWNDYMDPPCRDRAPKLDQQSLIICGAPGKKPSRCG